MLFDISLIHAMTADLYKGYLKIAILVAIGCHLDIYLELSKQEELIIQAFKNDTYKKFMDKRFTIHDCIPIMSSLFILMSSLFYSKELIFNSKLLHQRM